MYPKKADLTVGLYLILFALMPGPAAGPWPDS
jgi:hypothetical protein